MHLLQLAAQVLLHSLLLTTMVGAKVRFLILISFSSPLFLLQSASLELGSEEQTTVKVKAKVSTALLQRSHIIVR